MILSNVKIHEALDNGSLIIKPEPVPRYRGADGVTCPYKTSSVSLRLADEITCFEQQAIVVDLAKGGNVRKLVGAISERYTFPQNNPFELKPNSFVLGQTREHITLPLLPEDSEHPCLAARIEGRSSYSRFGLLVHFTAPTIHAGFTGTIILEIANFGPYSILLHKLSPICQLIIEQVSGLPFPNESQFQGQRTPTGPVEP